MIGLFTMQITDTNVNLMFPLNYLTNNNVSPFMLKETQNYHENLSELMIYISQSFVIKC